MSGWRRTILDVSKQQQFKKDLGFYIAKHLPLNSHIMCTNTLYINLFYFFEEKNHETWFEMFSFYKVVKSERLSCSR